MQLKVKPRQIQNTWMKKFFTGLASWTKGWSWMLVASGRMAEVENMRREKYYWEYSFLFRHEVLWKILEQIPHSRLGLLAKVFFSIFAKPIFLFGTTEGSCAHNVQGQDQTWLFSTFQGCISSDKDRCWNIAICERVQPSGQWIFLR